MNFLPVVSQGREREEGEKDEEGGEFYTVGNSLGFPDSNDDQVRAFLFR